MKLFAATTAAAATVADAAVVVGMVYTSNVVAAIPVLLDAWWL